MLGLPTPVAGRLLGLLLLPASIALAYPFFGHRAVLFGPLLAFGTLGIITALALTAKRGKHRQHH